MNIDNYQFVGVLYDGSSTAGQALKEVDKLRKEGTVKFKDAVAAYKKKGKVKLTQTKERRGMIGGGVLGLIVGIVLGGPIIAAAIGTLVGRVARQGFNNKQIKQVCDDMDVDESILFVAVEEADWGKLQSNLPEPKAVVYREVVPLEVVAAYENVSDDFEATKAIDEQLKQQDEE